jgi:hypothetical protein
MDLEHGDSKQAITSETSAHPRMYSFHKGHDAPVRGRTGRLVGCLQADAEMHLTPAEPVTARAKFEEGASGSRVVMEKQKFTQRAIEAQQTRLKTPDAGYCIVEGGYGW